MTWAVLIQAPHSEHPEKTLHSQGRSGAAAPAHTGSYSWAAAHCACGDTGRWINCSPTWLLSTTPRRQAREPPGDPQAAAGQQELVWMNTHMAGKNPNPCFWKKSRSGHSPFPMTAQLPAGHLLICLVFICMLCLLTASGHKYPILSTYLSLLYVWTHKTPHCTVCLQGCHPSED